MEKKNTAVNILLTGLLFLWLLAAALLDAFRPDLILSGLNIPMMLAMILAAFCAEYFMFSTPDHHRVPQALLAAAAFGVLPWAAGVIPAGSLWQYGLIGGVLFLITAYLFDSIAERLRSGAMGYAALLSAAFVLFLAGQCLSGIWI